MTTNRIDHTGCSHPATPAGRKGCRDRRRNVIRDAQKAYMGIDTGDTTFDEYREAIATVALALVIDTPEAYEIVENGPVIL